MYKNNTYDFIQMISSNYSFFFGLFLFLFIVILL